MSTHDTVIVGGGVTGLVAAWRLAEAGQDVVVLGFKHSGYGKDFSRYGLDDYTRVKHVMHSHG